MTPSVHLTRLQVESRRLYEFARRSRLSGRDFDEGYAVHALFAALFDHGSDVESRVAPKPFRLVDSTKRVIEVLGYTTVDHLALAERARAFGDPLAWGVCNLDELASRPIPLFETGRRLGFSVRVCPVRRVAKRGPQVKDRAEIDVYLARAWELNDSSTELDRETVYRQWLAEQFEKTGGARLLRASLESFRLGSLHRRTQGANRQGMRLRHPEALFAGVLEVLDPSAFHASIARGLGRHRSFGFGMMLLRPPGANLGP